MLVILGPTATGKTRLAVRLAHVLRGEIISADSRQVFKFMDIGTGKDRDDYVVEGEKIPFHLIDIVHPNEDYSVFHYKRDFSQAIKHILSHNATPILCGGTGLYLEAVLREFEFMEVPQNHVLRSELENESMEDLQNLLFKLNPVLHNTTDLLHKKRIIRAIEIAKYQIENKIDTDVLPENSQKRTPKKFVLGIRYPREILRQRITERLRARLNTGMIEEAERLLSIGITHQRLEFFGLEYRFLSRYLRRELTWNDMFQKLNTAIHQFSKRQMTFFRHLERKGINIHWIDGNDYLTAVDTLRENGFRFP